MIEAGMRVFIRKTHLAHHSDDDSEAVVLGIVGFAVGGSYPKISNH